jgi:hypothetical protein
VQHRRSDDVSRVQDHVGELELVEAGLGKPPRATRQVRVGDDGDAGQATFKKAPSR